MARRPGLPQLLRALAVPLACVETEELASAELLSRSNRCGASHTIAVSQAAIDHRLHNYSVW